MGTRCSRGTIPRAIAVAAVAGLLVTAQGPAGAAEGVSLTRTDNAREVAPGELEAVLAKANVIASLAAGEEVAAYGVGVKAQADSTVFLSLSSEYLMAACLSGAISSGPASADPGKVIVWHAEARSPKTFSFDVDRFLATTSAVLDPKVTSSLEQVSENHRQLIFWGLLRPTGVNAQAPVFPVVEEVRRAYLLAPTVIEIRRGAGGDSARLAALVAQRFVASVAERRLEPVVALMSPQLFQERDRAIDPAALRLLRTRFAEALIAGNLPDNLSGFELKATADESQWRVLTPKKSYRLNLNEIDGMFFVATLEPDKEADDLKN